MADIIIDYQIFDTHIPGHQRGPDEYYLPVNVGDNIQFIQTFRTDGPSYSYGFENGYFLQLLGNNQVNLAAGSITAVRAIRADGDHTTINVTDTWMDVKEFCSMYSDYNTIIINQTNYNRDIIKYSLGVADLTGNHDYFYNNNQLICTAPKTDLYNGAVAIEGAYNTVINGVNGDIRGTTTCIQLHSHYEGSVDGDASYNNIINQGKMSSSGAVVYIGPEDTHQVNSIENSGTMTSFGDGVPNFIDKDQPWGAIRSYGNYEDHIANDSGGIINGPGIWLGAADDTLANGGSIQTTYKEALFADDPSFIVGVAVKLQAGNDTYDASKNSSTTPVLYHATIASTDFSNAYVDGGTGNDLLKGGRGKDFFYGGDGNDTLSGGGGNDVLAGGKGADILFGDKGHDVFAFTDNLNGVADPSERATIVDFSAEDSIYLNPDVYSRAVFGFDGTLAANQFVIDTQARTSDQHIIFDASRGALFYDGDGSGSEDGLHLIAYIQNSSAVALFMTAAQITSNDHYLI